MLHIAVSGACGAHAQAYVNMKNNYKTKWCKLYVRLKSDPPYSWMGWCSKVNGAHCQLKESMEGGSLFQVGVNPSALFTWRVGERKHCLPGGLVNVSIVYLEGW